MTVPGFPRRFAPLVSAAFLMVVIATCGSAPTAHPDPTISVKPPPCAASYVINNGQLTVTVTSTGPAQVEVRVDAAELPRQVHTSTTMTAGQTQVVTHLPAPKGRLQVQATVVHPSGGRSCAATSASPAPG